MGCSKVGGEEGVGVPRSEDTRSGEWRRQGESHGMRVREWYGGRVWSVGLAGTEQGGAPPTEPPQRGTEGTPQAGQKFVSTVNRR